MDKEKVLQAFSFDAIMEEIYYATEYMLGNTKQRTPEEFQKEIEEFVALSKCDDLFYNTITSHLKDDLEKYLELNDWKEEALESFYHRLFKDRGIEMKDRVQH